MKKAFRKIIIIAGLFIAFISCKTDDGANEVDQIVPATFTFTHNWDGTSVTSSDFNTIQYTNENGQELSIERLRYLISDVTFTKDDGQIFTLDGYNLVDVTNSSGAIYNEVLEVPVGNYTSVAFTFGFDNEDNIDGVYQDLNSVSFNVPIMMGGGYHYMQFDGKYIDENDTEKGFNYHAIRAVDNPGANPTFPQDTFFEVDLGPVTIINTVTLEVQMNIAEWFKNPHTWNLNDLDTVLMPNSAAQIMMHDNGQSVFSLGTVIQ